MLAVPQHGFVFLAAPKVGSTSIQRALRRYAHLETRTPPSEKHSSARRFEAEVAPVLAADGFPRTSYQTVALVREPVDLVVSWWRYRSRPALDGQARSTAGVSLDDYAARVMSGKGGFPRPATWACDADGRVLVDLLWKYEHFEACVRWMSARIGHDLRIRYLNRSPERPDELSEPVRRELEEFFAAERKIYRDAQ